MRISRRAFIKSGGVAMIGMSTVPAFLRRAVAATPMPNRKRLVVLFQRGAADGLNIVVPFAEPNYYRIRPTIAIPQPRQGGEGAALDLDGFFGLHPSLAPLRPAVPEAATRHRARGRLAGHHALAFRCAGLHGVGHAGHEGDR